MSGEDIYNKIDFLGIGVVKSGTTWLAQCLTEHPDVFVPYQKEVNFFDSTKDGSNYSKGSDWYAKFFQKAEEGQIKGEFTTHYMFQSESADLIKKHLPDIKLIACLRNPVDMLYSFYWWKKANFESGTMADTFEGEIERDKNIIERGFYYKQLVPYFDKYPRESIKIILHDDIKESAPDVLRDTYGYLGVDVDFVPSSLKKRVNKSKKVRFMFLANLAHSVHGAIVKLGLDDFAKYLSRSRLVSDVYGFFNKASFKYPDINPQTRKKLYDIYAEDIEKLEGLLDRNLDAWKVKD